MSNSLPKKLEIELTEENVKEDMVKIVESLSKIRREAISNEAYSDEEREEYLHLTYRFASVLEHELEEDERLMGVVRKVVHQLDKNPRLIHYDSMQAEYWEEKLPGFEENLDRATVYLWKDELSDPEAKHHLLQALKYLGVRDSPEEERNKALASILPVQSPVPFEKSRLFDRLVAAIFGHRVNIENNGDYGVDLSIKDGAGVGAFSGETEGVLFKAAKKIEKHGCISFTCLSYEMNVENIFKDNVIEDIEDVNNSIQRFKVFLKNPKENKMHGVNNDFNELAKNNIEDIKRMVYDKNIDYAAVMEAFVDKYRNGSGKADKWIRDFKNKEDFEEAFEKFCKDTANIVSRRKKENLPTSLKTLKGKKPVLEKTRNRLMNYRKTVENESKDRLKYEFKTSLRYRFDVCQAFEWVGCYRKNRFLLMPLDGSSRNYVLSFIIPLYAVRKSSVTSLDEMLEAFVSSKPLEDRLKSVTEKLGAVYANVKQYEERKLVEDISCFN